MLTVIDEFSRECLDIVVGRKIDSSDVLYTLANTSRTDLRCFLFRP
jgi:hypothetical protein